MFPSIFALGVRGLGPLTGKGSGLLVASIVGGAIVPELQGIFADHIGIHRAFFLPAICYLYILYFAVACSRMHGRAALENKPLGPQDRVNSTASDQPASLKTLLVTTVRQAWSPTVR